MFSNSIQNIADHVQINSSLGSDIAEAIENMKEMSLIILGVLKGQTTNDKDTRGSNVFMPLIKEDVYI